MWEKEKCAQAAGYRVQLVRSFGEVDDHPQYTNPGTPWQFTAPAHTGIFYRVHPDDLEEYNKQILEYFHHGTQQWVPYVKISQATWPEHTSFRVKGKTHFGELKTGPIPPKTPVLKMLNRQSI